RKENDREIEESVETLRRKGRPKDLEEQGDGKQEYGAEREVFLQTVEENADTPKKGVREASGRKTVKEPRKIDPASRYALPPVTLLEKGKEVAGEERQYIEASMTVIQSTLDSFGIQGKVISHVSGPRVTRYEISLEPGVKVERISNLERNFSMDLQAKSVRILAPIPGKNTVGIEVPNSNVSSIPMRSIMESGVWGTSINEIPIILGRDVSGAPVVTDLARAPHLLIAGTTGSGKSVCMHSIMMSLLFRFSPSELKLILVDPKMVEFALYIPLPHLMIPVVNEPAKVQLALHWGVNEMERRYRIFSKASSKKLSEYNRREKPAVPVLDEDGSEIPDRMPILVIIIDELADIMMTEARASVENSIARIAQKGRAAGIHIVVATQTPRKQIITGVIKANFPTRIAFQVSAIVDSGVILDRKGAEKLLGKGDMLFIPPGSSNLERIQGTMVSDGEIEKVVNFVSGQMEQRFDETVLSGKASELDAELPFGQDGEGDEDDSSAGSEEELVKRAIEAILTDGKASTSYVQRRLNIGYNKAANIIEIIERKGIVGPPVGANAKRQILVSRDEYRG
ncbi:MAG: DNA translocase FtsK, partial [Victivallales bacterium]